MPQRPKHLKKSDDFPKLSKKSHDVTSDIDPRYNCIAYAAGITNRKYWPAWHPDYYWPADVPRAETLDAFKQLYETFGYSGPSTNAHVEGIEKIAIFTDKAGKPTHAAFQLPGGRWASKLGNGFDIEHDELAVSGGLYGQPVYYMERPKK